ncbi:MAG: hypothetical protein WCI18_03065 [Pseudomonadota bacterium]
MKKANENGYIAAGLLFLALQTACQPLKPKNDDNEVKLFGLSLGERNQLAGAGWIKEPLQLDTEYVSPDEKERHEGFAKIIRVYQNERIQVNHGIKRGFHAKQLGCTLGRFQVLDQIPSELQQGVFLPGKSYDVMARFSSGLGTVEKDAELDVKGLALKLLNIDGPKLIQSKLPNENLPNSRSVDFTMTNVPTFGTKNSTDFMEFAKAAHDGNKGPFLFKHPIALQRLAGSVSRKIGDLGLESFWSGGASRLGQKTMKFRVAPCDGRKQYSPTRKVTENYFRESLQEHLNSESVCYDFYVQMQLDPYKQPIENPQEFWKENETPSILMAKVTFDKQDLAQNDAICESITFHPWNTIAAHQPLGEVNRARMFIYHASSAERSKGGIQFDPPNL